MGYGELSRFGWIARVGILGSAMKYQLKDPYRQWRCASEARLTLKLIGELHAARGHWTFFTVFEDGHGDRGVLLSINVWPWARMFRVQHVADGQAGLASMITQEIVDELGWTVNSPKPANREEVRDSMHPESTPQRGRITDQ